MCSPIQTIVSYKEVYHCKYQSCPYEFSLKRKVTVFTVPEMSPHIHQNQLLNAFINTLWEKFYNNLYEHII